MRILLWASALVLVALASGTPESVRARNTERARPARQQLLRKGFTNCGGNVELKPGDCEEIHSPNFPNNYKRNARCLWKFTTHPPNTPITICCDVFQLQKSLRCMKDNVIFTDGEDKKKLCGERLNLAWQTHTGVLNVSFKSNSFHQNKGFNCTVCASDSPATSPYCTCGMKNNGRRIIGGAPAMVRQYPWHVGITKELKKIPFCGGSIISNRWILTAAHCGVRVNDIVIVGAHDWCTCRPPHMRIPVKQVVLHKDYNAKTYKNDIALLELSQEIPFPADNSIAPICLPDRPLDDWQEVDAIATGWGSINWLGIRPCVLHHVFIKTQTLLDCLATWPGEIFDSMFCAGVNVKGTCSGDSGGPLFTNEEPSVQIGVTSLVAKLCDRPQIYTRVFKFVPWIKEACGDSVTCAPNLPMGIA